PQGELDVNGSVIVRGLVAPGTGATNLLNLGSGATADGFRNGISFFEGGGALGPTMSFGYDGVGNASQNALRIYNSGNVPLFTFQAGGGLGIATTTPATALHVKDSLDAEISVESTDAGSHRWTLQSSRVTGNTNTDASFQIIDRTIGGGVSRLLIGTNGNVGIGTVAPAGKLHVNGTAGNNSGVWSSFSDRRLKEHIEPMAAGSLDQLLRLEGVTYDYTRPELREGYDGVHRGWIAQQVEQVFPEWVSQAPDGMKMVTPVGFNALTVEALRELRAEKDTALQALEEQLRAKDARIAELEERMLRL